MSLKMGEILLTSSWEKKCTTSYISLTPSIYLAYKNLHCRVRMSIMCWWISFPYHSVWIKSLVMSQLIFTHIKSILIFALMTGQVSRSSPKKPRCCNLFKALFCCLRGAQAAPKPLPPSQDALLELQDNGDVVKVTEYIILNISAELLL